MLNGIDVSKWQGKMDWAKAKASGIDFAIIRAGSINDVTGVCYEDFEYRNNLEGLADTGIPYALYWYFRPNHSAVKQAEFFLDLASDAWLGELKVDLWCDIEVEGDAAKVKAFVDLISQAIPPAGIYTNLNTVKYLLKGDKSWMPKYALWLADYTAPYPAPAPYTEWLVLQYSSTGIGADYGSPAKNIDLNYAQDDYLPPELEPDDELELRVTALEEIVSQQSTQIVSLAKAWNSLEDLLTALTARVTALEQHPTPSGAVFRIGSSTANARYAKSYNQAGKPIMEIFEPRVQFKPDTLVSVNPVAVTADGGSKYFRLTDGYTTPLYLRAQDGVLQVG